MDRLLKQFRLSDKTGLSEVSFVRSTFGRSASTPCTIVSSANSCFWMSGRLNRTLNFGRKFYDELLPDLMRARATVVVITHDDRYLDELDLPARKIQYG